ncbi:hypothetical protein [Aureimonas mangrovi]|uniref:hypothetical protein n=1 Tax=Aureimonas mangrovi TaxID=2758041 RepID=UPI00163D407E|nr:hypothetical protein [Aureimonas mangrovi]
MDGIEESLRRALGGGDAQDPAFRQSIYEASQRAIERMIEARGLDEERAYAERMRLYETMQRVEAEYSGAPAATFDGERADASEPARYEPADPHSSIQPSGARAPGSYAAPAAVPQEGEPVQEEVWTPGAGRARTRRANRLPALIAVIFAVLVLAAALYWFLADGSDSQADETASLTPAVGEAAPPPLDWINVFDGTDLQRLAAPSGGRIEEVDAQGRQAVRLAGPQGSEGEIVLDLGAGLARDLAGADVRIEVVAGSPDDDAREFSVRCVFSDANVCERQRFLTTMHEEAFVFDVTVPEGAEAPANLAIGPGLSADGPDIDLFSVRMRRL